MRTGDLQCVCNTLLHVEDQVYTIRKQHAELNIENRAATSKIVNRDQVYKNRGENKGALRICTQADQNCNPSVVRWYHVQLFTCAIMHMLKFAH